MAYLAGDGMCARWRFCSVSDRDGPRRGIFLSCMVKSWKCRSNKAQPGTCHPCPTWGYGPAACGFGGDSTPAGETQPAGTAAALPTTTKQAQPPPLSKYFGLFRIRSYIYILHLGLLPYPVRKSKQRCAGRAMRPAQVPPTPTASGIAVIRCDHRMPPMK